MRRRLPFKTILLLASCLIANSSGCGIYNPRHGTILRGSWSLECNRVPWLNSRTRSYDEVGESGCGQGMVTSPAIGNADGTVSALYPAQPAAHVCASGPLACRSCAQTASATPVSPPMGHSRFHPVPTRPVFTPWKCPTAATRKSAPVRPARPSQPEVIPTPEASLSTMVPTRADSRVKNAAWIFQPEDSSVPTIAAR